MKICSNLLFFACIVVLFSTAYCTKKSGGSRNKLTRARSSSPQTFNHQSLSVLSSSPYSSPSRSRSPTRGGTVQVIPMNNQNSFSSKGISKNDEGDILGAYSKVVRQKTKPINGHKQSVLQVKEGKQIAESKKYTLDRQPLHNVIANGKTEKWENMQIQKNGGSLKGQTTDGQVVAPAELIRKKPRLVKDALKLSVEQKQGFILTPKKS